MKTKFDLTKTFIRIDNNEVRGGYFTEARFFGTLPRCRKAQLLTIQLMRGGVILRPLFGHADAREEVPVEEWRAFLKSLAVRPYMSTSLVVTPELEAMARAKEEAVCDCPAVRG